jgi:hypothetical protein
MGTVFESFDNVMGVYDTRNNKTSNIMTCYEKTNIIGFRLEQLSFGSVSMLEKEDLDKCNSIRDVVLMELKMNLMPFIICRTVNTSKEYWKIKDMIILC